MYGKVEVELMQPISSRQDRAPNSEYDVDPFNYFVISFLIAAFISEVHFTSSPAKRASVFVGITSLQTCH